MTARASVIGVGVANDAVRAVGVRRGRILWALERARHDTLESSLTELLRAAPRGWRKPAVVAAIGPSHSQVKRLEGLPEVRGDAPISRIVQESAGRFFLRNGVPLATSDARRAADGTVWAAAFEMPVLHAVADACAATKMRLHAVMPSASVVRHATNAERYLWRDGDSAVDVEIAGGRPISVRRSSPNDVQERSTPITSTRLATLGGDGWRFADAAGAALSDHNDELAWYPHAQGRNADLLPRGRLALAAGACSLALLTALLAPGAAAARSARQSMREWQALSARSQRASTTRVALEGVTAALADVARFDSARHDATLLLADLARALPDGSALVTLRLTAQGGHIVALSARASHVIAALEKVSGIESPEIVGPVTRESVGGRQVERTTIRFRLGGSTPRREEKSS